MTPAIALRLALVILLLALAFYGTLGAPDFCSGQSPGSISSALNCPRTR